MKEFNLTRELWTSDDIENYKSYVLTFSKGKEKGEWEKRIINTNLDCISVPSDILENIAVKIYKGNYVSFLSFWCWDNFSFASVIGRIIVKIQDFNKMKFYLDKYVSMCDNWANCDLLKFKINKNNKEYFFNLAKEYLKSQETFVRRTGVVILLKMIKVDIKSVFKIIKELKNETEYYVNMAVAWLMCDAFIYDRELTLKLFEDEELNDFVINKAISKCRDSYRVSKEDKEMLLNFKQKRSL